MKQIIFRGIVSIMAICCMLCGAVLGAVHIDYNPDGSMKKITFDTNEDRINYQKYHEEDVRLYGTGVEAEVKESPKFYTYEEIEQKWPIEGFTRDDLEIVKQWFIDNIPDIKINKAYFIGAPNGNNMLTIAVKLTEQDYEPIIKQFMKWLCTSQYVDIFGHVSISFEGSGLFSAMMIDPANTYTTDDWDINTMPAHFTPGEAKYDENDYGMTLYN